MSITTNAQTIVGRLELPSWKRQFTKRNFLLLKLDNQQVFTIFADKYNASCLDQLTVGTKVSVKENWFGWRLKAAETQVAAESYELHKGRERQYDDWRFCEKATVQGVIVDKENQCVYIGVSGNWYECPMDRFDYNDMWILFLKKGDTVGFATFITVGIFDFSLRLRDIYSLNKSSMPVNKVSADYIKKFYH